MRQLLLNILSIIYLFSHNVMAEKETPMAIIESKLDYKIEYSALEKGNFQYFYRLVRPEDGGESKKIADVFKPLDTKNLWDPKDGNYMAVAKFNYMLPIEIKKIDESKLSSKAYLQKTLPSYKVTKRDKYFHVGGSFMTPDFNVYLTFLDADHPFTKLMPEIDTEKMRSGKMKVSFMHQDSFGRVMMFRTAKMASAISIYEEHGPDQTLVTQYILSNIINVPSENIVKKGMIENLQNVVEGSREAAKDF